MENLCTHNPQEIQGVTASIVKRETLEVETALDDVIDSFETNGLDLEALEEPLRALASEHPSQHQVLMLHFYCGLKTGDIAEITDTPLRTVQYHVDFAKSFLRDTIGQRVR